MPVAAPPRLLARRSHRIDDALPDVVPPGRVSVWPPVEDASNLRLVESRELHDLVRQQQMVALEEVLPRYLPRRFELLRHLPPNVFKRNVA